MVEILDAEKELRAGLSPSQVVNGYAFHTRVYGGYFTKGGMGEHYKLKKGQKLILKSDTENEVDCFAIKVFSEKGVELGFIKRELAAAIISIKDYECTVEREMDIEDSMASTKNSFGVGILLVNKNWDEDN